MNNAMNCNYHWNYKQIMSIFIGDGWATRLLHASMGFVLMSMVIREGCFKIEFPGNGLNH